MEGMGTKKEVENDAHAGICSRPQSIFSKDLLCSCRLFQRNGDVLLGLSSGNLAFACKPAESKEKILVVEFAGSLLQVLSCEGSLLVEGIPDFTGDDAGLFVDHLL